MSFRPDERTSLMGRINGYQVSCPHCRARFTFAAYRPGLIRCGKCKRVFNLR